jgi:hypothetical protein
MNHKKALPITLGAATFILRPSITVSPAPFIKRS